MMVPMVVEKTSNSQMVMDIYSRLLKDRVIMLSGEINTQMANVIIAQLLFLEAEDPEKDIYLYINSGGGSCSDGLSIYSTLQFIKPSVNTIITGMACSMASVLAQAGAPGKRFMLPESFSMVHSVRGNSGYNTVWDAAIQMEQMMKTNTKLTNIYVKHNTKGKTFEDFTEIMNRDYYMTPEETIEFGLADEIMYKRP